MDSPRPGGPLRFLAALLGLFLGGAAIGVGLAETFAPGSGVANVASFFALPAAFALGLQLWYGLALVHLVVRLVLRRRPPPASGMPQSRVGIPGGSFVFLPLGSAAGATAGVVVGLVAPDHPGWLVWLVYWAVGTAHGLLGWRLAGAGILTPPESLTG